MRKPIRKITVDKRKAPLIFYLSFILLALSSNVRATDKVSGLKHVISNVPIEVRGVVTDEKGEPLIGVSVKDKATGKGTISDINGKFSIKTETGNTLVFSYLGFKTQEVIASKSTLKVTLVPNDALLDEVVVVGYGEQKKESVVGSIAQVKGDDLKRVGGVTTVSEALQGLSPGLTAVSSNGKPGADAASIFIRGKSSWQKDLQPLTLVDGVERDLNNVDANEIETISILKDASATAVFGVRGANGVIIITTKRGKVNKPEFTFSSNFGFKEPTVRQDNANFITTMQMFNEAAANDKRWDLLIPESKIQAWNNNIQTAGPYNQYFPQVNWFDEMIKKVGYQQNYNLNASGGSELMKYFVSLGYTNDGDIFKTQKNKDYDPSFGLKRYNWRSNFDFDFTKTTRFAINFSGNFRYRNQTGFRLDGGGEGNGNFFSSLYQAPTNIFPIRYADGEFGDSPGGNDNRYMLTNEGGQRIYKYYEGFYDASLTQKLDFVTKGLVARGRASFTSASNYESSILRDGIAGNTINFVRYYREYDITQPIVAADGTVSYPLINSIRFPAEAQLGPVNASYDNIYGYDRKLYYEVGADYKRDFGKHAVSGLILASRQSQLNQDVEDNRIAADRVNIDVPQFRQDFVGRITYAYNNRYLTEFNGNYAGSEKFGPDYKYGFFKSASAGWIITEEPFMKKLLKDSRVLNFLKTRYSYGEVGSDRGAARFSHIQSYTEGGNISLGSDNRNDYGPIYSEGAIANPLAQWELSKKQNLGVEFELFSHLKGTLDFFNEKRSKILMDRVTTPVWLGNDIKAVNLGRTKNHGYEASLNYTDKIGAAFRYYVNANYSWSENRIEFRDDPRLREEYLRQAGKQIGFSNRIINSGYYQSLDDIYNYASPNFLVPQSSLVPGDMMYVDFNADGVVDTKDAVALQNTTTPLSTYGLNLGFGYKNWSFNMLLYGVSDVSKTIPALIQYDFAGGQLLSQVDVLDRWTPQNPGADKPSLHIANTGHNQQSSSYNFVDGSYMRLKNAEVSYKLKGAYLKKAGLNAFQIYVNGSNLLTFSRLDSRIDPETDGVGVYPIVRRYNLGLRASF